MDLTAVQRRTLDDLIGREAPPDLPSDLSERVRARLEEGLARAGVTNAGWTAANQLWVGKSLLNDNDRCQGLFDARLQKEGPPFEHSAVSGSGVLFHKGIEIDVITERGSDIRSVCERAALRTTQTDGRFAAFWDSLDPFGRAELVAEAGRRLALFRDSFPPTPRSWQPQTELALKVRLAAGSVVLSGAPDLMLGRSRRLLMDLKSAGAWPEYPEDLRFYALLLLLRIGVPPYRVATFFLQSGDWQAEDVTEVALIHAADRVIGAVRTAVRVAGGGTPDLRPGPHCSWCPRATTCPESLVTDR
jgi:hypothetical protein